MRRSALAALLLLPLLSLAQDTITVSTLTFDSITTRRGWWTFPPAGTEFRKVLMVHTLKCDPQTTQDQYDCGEWDYLTYHFVHEHTGVLDSNALQHPWFKVGVVAPDSVLSTDLALANVRQFWQRNATVLAVNGAVLATVGTPDAQDSASFIPFKRRSQYLFTAAELAAAGLVAGPIHELRFHRIGNAAALVDRCIIRMKQTAATAIDRFEDSGFTTVIDRTLNYDTLALPLSAPFAWDGTSNLLVDIANEGTDVWLECPLQATAVAPGTALQEIGRDDAVHTGDDFIGVDPAPLAALSDAVTITVRTYGAPQLPLNTTLLEAVNANGQRVMNIHLPWSNGRVYWDAGNNGGAYDRIDKAAVEAEYEGGWTDWAFVKNATTGSMKIYRNGVLWHSATNKVLPLDGIVRMRVASDANGGNPYPGMIDGLNIFNTELTAATIAAWHDRKVTADHPDHAALVYSLEMDEGYFSPYAVNAADPTTRGWFMGTVERVERPATELFRNPVDPGVRPVITFCQGDYSVALDSVINSAPPSEFLPHLSREVFAVQGNGVVPVDTVFARLAGWRYTYAPDGLVVDSTWSGGELFVNDTLDYFGTPYEVVNNHEIGRYITPYGIGLDLGDEGFSWVYDVTDYQYLLHDSVELSAGNQQELIDLKFLMIEGQAPRPVVNVQHPWGPMRSYSYASLSDDSQLAPVTVDLHPDATQWMVRSRLTGHGHNSNNGQYPHCCEWKDNTHYLYANGQEVDEWHIWQEIDCANNPVYPQGGTWPGSREGWCPGDLVKDRDTELNVPVPGGTLTLDYGITPVPADNLGMGGGNYVVNMDLFEFGPAAHAVDAEVYDVYRPTTDQYRSRENPICYDPVIVLRNAGAQLLTSVTFSYGVSGGQPATYTWTGNLAHMRRQAVTLPIPSPQFWAGDAGGTFHVTITDVNGGGPDAYAANDAYTTHYTLPVIYPGPIVLYHKSNQRPWENALTVRDINGQVVFSRTDMTAATIYRDTLDLPPGCYEVELSDSGLDGLAYWADPDAGTGFFKFRNLLGQTVRNFDSEFGYRIKAAFAIGTITSTDEHVAPVGVSLWPNPTTDRAELRVDGVLGAARLELLDATGRAVWQQELDLLENKRIPIDLAQAPAGLYTVRLTHERGASTTRLLKQ